MINKAMKQNNSRDNHSQQHLLIDQLWKYEGCSISKLITLTRGYEKCPFGSLLSFIQCHIMYFHFHGIRSRVEQGAS